MSVLSRITLAPRLASLLRQPSRRTFGSAAAQLDYDDYYYHEVVDEEKMPDTAKSEEWETTVGRGVQWVIMADPTVRRHVYAERLAELLNVPHISMGSLLRQELSPNSSLYKKIASSVNHGKLVPEDVIFGLLTKRLEEGYCRGETGFILEGIPRTTVQAEILDQIADIDLVLNLKCNEEFVVKKMFGGGIYSASRQFHSIGAGSGFNLSFEPKVGNLQSSVNKSDTIWKDKLRQYEQQKKPLEEYYKRQKKLLDFQVAGAPGDAWQGLLAALQLQHMNAITSATNFSQKLTA